ncbi:MAG: hypothetical protein M1822_007583 [Bathelium mastoideum]|nr:MAG: hypothetical protein M1822_007583 [Bathelium mastoideum]
MQQALEILEIPCWHGVSAFSRISDCSKWRAALEAKFFNKGQPFSREQWDRLLGDFGAVSDVPAIAFAEDLIAAYPEAKVILVERDRDRWFNSFNEAVIGPCWNPVLQVIARCEKMNSRQSSSLSLLPPIPFPLPTVLLRSSSLDPWFLGPLNSVTQRWVRGWFDANSADDMRAKALFMYEHHYALVRSITPKHRLLEFSLESKWEPLCEFLGKPVPNNPFPHANERDAIRAMVWDLGRKGAKMILYRFLVLIVPCVAFGICYWLTGFK